MIQQGEGAALVSREQSRRRGLLLGAGALLLLSVGPVFGHHLSSGLERGLAGRDHLGSLCLIALHEMLAPVHLLFHLLIAGGVAYAAFDRIRAFVRVRRTVAPLDTSMPVPGDPFWIAALAGRVEPVRVRIVAGLPNPAFTIGWLSPRIYVARSLAQRLTPDELSAVLAHEGAHVERRDPLRLSVLRFLGFALFWIPAFRRLAADMADEAEILADDRAARDQPLALASALLALAGWGGGRDSMEEAVGFASRSGLLDRRIRRLAGEEPLARTHVTRGSLSAALLALVGVWISGAIMAHPLPPGGMDHSLTHCFHPREWAALHLFCNWTPRGDGRCPHIHARASGGRPVLPSRVGVISPHPGAG